ncbi:C-type lectin domain family 18 member C [Elysia marginata]|uniref:C-type lectin domain family 18 member C n=1 Tax=Elysia marginata TaxID=1093978 RepID=A0AAV4G173_9GAST|nr:C-type lectin domain family 18 member C [Elysia marginata]
MDLVLAALFVVAHSVSAAAQSIQSCPQSAVEIAGPELFRVRGSTCYLFMTYDHEKYENTRLKCQQHGGTLAMPKTKTINDFLQLGMAELEQRGPMWIGLRYNVTTGSLVWSDGETVLWDNLDQDFKVRQKVSGEYCIVLYPGDGKWHPHLCSTGPWYSSYMPFICEYSISNEDKVMLGSRQDRDQILSAGDTLSGQGTNGDDYNDDLCPAFNCPDMDCGMSGFKLKHGCQVCECNEDDGNDGDLCPNHNCLTGDCGMSGFTYKLVNGCRLCECNKN